MTKRELVIDVAERLGYTQNEVSSVVQATLDSIIECLAEGQRLEVRNFGVFEIKKRDARMGRNPRTGQEVPIAEKRVATFKPGKALKELVAGEISELPSDDDSDDTPQQNTPDPSTPPQGESGGFGQQSMF